MRRTKKEIMDGVDCVKSRLVDHNTVEYWRKDGSKVIRLHLTDIITYNPDGSVTFNTDGWKTVTTKDRMNKFSPFKVHQEKSVWYVETYPFEDGVTFYPDGKVEGEGDDPKKYIKLNKDINKYVKGFMTELVNRRIPQPSGGDCWDCCMKTEEGRTMGELSKSNHILSHFEEKYYVPSLLMNAIEQFTVSPVANNCIGYWLKYHEQESGWGESFGKSQVEKSLKRYLKRQLGMAA